MTQTASEAPEQSIYDIPPDDDNKPQTPFANGHKSEGEDDERPSKRRRVSEGPSKARPKIESPPWKKAVAEGPSSFTQDGIRKSGRTNRIPLELQPQSGKRQTRGASSKTSAAKGKHGETSENSSPTQTRDSTGTSVNGAKRPVSAGQPPSQQPPKSPAKASTPPKRSHHRKSVLNEQPAMPVRSHKKKTPITDPQNTSAQAHPTRDRRLVRASETLADEQPRPRLPKAESVSGPSPGSKLSKIKFRIRPPKLPFPHAGLVLARPKQCSTFAEFIDTRAGIPTEEGGLLVPEDGPRITPDIAMKDAQILLRIENATKPGGLLAPGLCSAYKPEKQDLPPDQYAHRDHLNRAVKEFRKLMLMEHNKHRAAAKKIAEACRDEWIRRQPKTAEQLEAEEIKENQARYRALVKVLQATWENVRTEVNEQRAAEWTKRQQDRARKALEEVVDISEQKLEARRLHINSEVPTDEEDNDASGFDDELGSYSGEGSSEDRESNMSSTESEDDEDQILLGIAEDEKLSAEQLREKYASLHNVKDDNIQEEPNENFAAEQNSESGNPDDDDSDESIDMDDDMGSSDEDRGSEDDDRDEESEDEGDDPVASSLLGFLAPAELKSMENDPPDREPTPMEYENEPSAADQVSTLNAYHLTPAIEDPEIEDRTDIKAAKSESPERIIEITAASPDRSSQPTPRTTETRPSEADSASSIDLQQHSRQATGSATPQPTSHLKTPVPFLLRGTLREYQHFGLDWLAGLYANETNGILADEMGLGKTIQTIALLAHLACEHHVWGPHLVIVPTSVMLNWEMEFKKFLPGFKILTYYGTQDERRRKRSGWLNEDSFNVIITSYQLVLQDQQVFKRRRWHYMILDEAHNIKNFQSQRWQTMLTFNTRARLLLTGTPLQNNLTELWSLLYFLMPAEKAEKLGNQNQGVEGFANLKEFQDWFKKPSEQILEHGREQMDDESKAIISKLHKVLRPYLLRRLKADVEKQMPAKYEHVEFCRLSKRQRELYDSFLNREDTRGTLAGGNYLSIVNCLMQLRKVCNHPDLFLDRPIMTSFPMEKSAVADFEIKDLLVRRRLLQQDPMTKVSLDFLNLVPAKHEELSGVVTARSYMLSTHRLLMDMQEAQRMRAQLAFTNFDPATVKSNLVYLESASRWRRFEELQHCVYLNALRRQQKPIYGRQLVQLLSFGINERPLRPKPSRRNRMIEWLEESSPVLQSMVPTLDQRSEALNTTLQKFACVTPPVVARDMTPLLFTPKGVNNIQTTIANSDRDPFHEARMRLSIQFPDKRLLQYDCGKLQTLDKLLRKLQAGGHRALIFTQMTKVLDILEQFLNIHGHKYLRLDGATKIEQRQILTDRFNNDTRILAFILSSRSGGLGINLTGADTVIFYDLDWNPAMDKQCTDRAHRIGQTRDVHIYRLVSEHTIEANILRKANQKRMLDDVVIQEGEFTTDYFNKMSVRDVLAEGSALVEGDAVANAAMDRVLGGPDSSNDVQRVLAQAEDREDVAAAKIAEREIVQTDAADFDEKDVNASATPAGIGTPGEGLPTPAAAGSPAAIDMIDLDAEDDLNAWGQPIGSSDDYMLRFMTEQLKDVAFQPLPDRNKRKRGRDGRHRSHRAR